MEIQGSCVDERHGWDCDWEPTRAWTSETHRHSVKEMLADFFTKHVDVATMSNCMTGRGMKFQSGESKLTLKA